MSSGEADRVKIYDVSVVHTPTQSETNHGDWTASLSTTYADNTFNTSNTFNYYSSIPNSTYYWWSYPTYITKYMYQIRCPRCRKMNWCEMDAIVSCKKCSAQIRAVSKRVDFDVEVEP